MVTCSNGPLQRESKIFGVSLSTLDPCVPYVVRKCVREIEKRGIKTPFIYKDLWEVPIKGNRTTFKLMNSFEISQHLTDVSHCEAHDLAYLIKQFFCMLPVPLIPEREFNEMVKIAEHYRLALHDPISPESDVLREVKRVLASLSRPHLSTLSFLILHLRKVTDNSRYNLMTPDAVAVAFSSIIFGKK
ncbi:minor histocompatibility protein HA-1-like protein [Dinothrombium tinctorium]|uniref:Minor histocompatibility protein HA-1-like protein n=1 Tax=Dinothrombium tinctorium TaxID=1965070 RepID=A0A443QD59_9ACAR|nr:minor histocompatibility protein HA-1-like protein [Dinothrombium tinctorium]